MLSGTSETTTRSTSEAASHHPTDRTCAPEPVALLPLLAAAASRSVVLYSLSVAHWVAAAARGGCGCLGLAALRPGVGLGRVYLVAPTSRTRIYISHLCIQQTQKGKINNRYLRYALPPDLGLTFSGSSAGLPLLPLTRASTSPCPWSTPVPIRALTYSTLYYIQAIDDSCSNSDASCQPSAAVGMTPFGCRSKWVDAQV